LVPRPFDALLLVPQSLFSLHVFQIPSVFTVDSPIFLCALACRSARDLPLAFSLACLSRSRLLLLLVRIAVPRLGPLLLLSHRTGVSLALLLHQR
jgi:hypothetical protein